MGKGLDEHRATHRLDGYRAIQSLVGLNAHCANSYIPHVQHIIQYICAVGCRNLQCALSPTKLCLASCMCSPMLV